MARMRRKRSEMSVDDAVKACRVFSKSISRFAEIAHCVDGCLFGETPDGQIDVLFRLRGNFGVADEFFEAMRVLGEHKLPRRRVT